VPRTPTNHRPHHAVVIGAGLGGLAAAQALSRHFERVTLVERDDLPDRPTSRAGVPQGRHLHVLMPGGLAALERLLPGYGAELVAHGAVRLEAPREVAWLTAAGWMCPFDHEQRQVLSASRDLIEWVTRRLVLDTPQVIVRCGLEVTGLAVSDTGSPPSTGRVRAVEVRPRGATTADPTESIRADLVVDASGRRSHTAAWLQAAGYMRPSETTVDAELAYASRIYRRGRDDLGGWKAVFLQAQPPYSRRMGLLFPIERDRWMLTVAGTNGDVPPTDERGLVEFARGMRAPTLADAIERLEPLTPIVGYRRTENRRRHYESVRMPDGFIVVGDAACAFNPVYGQGMSVAALTAEALDRCLHDHLARHGDLSGVSARAQQAAAKANATAWTVATGEDLRYPETRGGRVSAADRVMRRYFDRVVAAATVDPVANAAFFDVLALLAEPTSLLRPALMTRVLGRRRSATADGDAPPPPPRPRGGTTAGDRRTDGRPASRRARVAAGHPASAAAVPPPVAPRLRDYPWPSSPR
jgi:2-polyprenyl-6-methoxyphenol hydroxylase-like FAD-dependent oxidoreductase